MKVKKELAQEEVAVLSNIQSMINELMQMQGGQVEAGNQEDDSEQDEIVVSKAGDAEADDTASDDAEDRMSDQQTESTEDNAEEVAKAILRLANSQKKTEIKKSISQPSPVIEALNGLAKVVKELQSNQDEQSMALAAMLDGMGVTKQLEAAREKDKPVEKSGDLDAVKFLHDLKSAISTPVQKSNEPQFVSQSTEAMKGLQEESVMKALFSPVRK